MNKISVKQNGITVKKFGNLIDAYDFIDNECAKTGASPNDFEVIETIKENRKWKEQTNYRMQAGHMGKRQRRKIPSHRALRRCFGHCRPDADRRKGNGCLGKKT